MRDFQLQTPQRDQSSGNRRSKSTTGGNKNLQKVPKKNLNPEFKAASFEDSPTVEPLKEKFEVYGDNPFGESAENFIALVNPADTPSSATLLVSDFSSPSCSSTIITPDKDASVYSSGTTYENSKVDSKTESIAAEMVIKHLREAKLGVLKSKDVGHSKKLLDALINVVIEEFYGGLYEEKEWLYKLLSTKANLVFLSFFLGIVTIFSFCYFYLGANEFHNGPVPT